jgi:uncharacterized protein DUF222
MAMDASTALRVAELWFRVERHSQAQSMIPICEAVDHSYQLADGTGQLPGELVGQELALALKVPYGSALERVGLSADASTKLDRAWVALDRGQISLQHFRRLANVVGDVSPRTADAVEAAVMPHQLNRPWTPNKLAAEADKALIAIDPDGAAERERNAGQQACVHFQSGRNKTAKVTAHGDAIEARQAMDAINARAEELQRHGDTRPLGQRQFAAFTELILGRDQAGRPQVEVLLSLDFSTWLGITNRPGEISGYGPISPEAARALAADASFRRFLTDPVTGQLIDLGLARYRPSAALQRFVKARDVCCRFVGCDRPAKECDTDHDLNFGAGGRTDRHRLHSLCRRHHNGKTKKVWHVEIQPDFTETWYSPYGTSYTSPADRVPLEQLEPPPDLVDLPESSVPPHRDAAIYANGGPPPAEPPLDPYEYEELSDALDRGWGAYADRAYNLLRAAQLI